MIVPFKEYKTALKKLHHHSQLSVDLSLQKQVLDIQKHVQKRGDAALIELAQKFDNVPSDGFELQVQSSEIDGAFGQVAPKLIDALKNAHANITTFHKKQYPKDWSDSPAAGVEYGQRFTPLDRVGLYVPGGRAVYPSTVLMNAIPAKIAGVAEIVIATPAQPDGSIAPAILVAAKICGVDKIVKSGGAQVIFALASGTQSVPEVDKIVGPGNKYVTAAKQLVYGQVDIDKPAGPSEVCVYIDTHQYTAFAAAELLAQLEHDPDAIGVAVCVGSELAAAVETAFNDQITRCSRQDILQVSKNNLAIIEADDPSGGIEVVNGCASEHVVVLSDAHQSLMAKIRHGGSIFCGPYTPVTLGDYYAGPNHVLPTSAAARFASPLGVMDFMKYSTHLTYSKDALNNAQADLQTLTESEGFDAHYHSVSVRLEP